MQSQLLPMSVQVVSMDSDTGPFRKGDVLTLAEPCAALIGDWVVLKSADGSLRCEVFQKGQSSKDFLGVVINDYPHQMN